MVSFRILLSAFFFWSASGALAQDTASVKALKPVSLSYEKVKQCFPELEEEKLSEKFDLNKLKDAIDEKFVTSRSQLRQRKVRYLSATGETMQLVVRPQELVVQKVDDKGVVTEVRTPGIRRINPTQEVVNSFLLSAILQSDEYSYFDTKLKGVSMTYRRNFKEIEELQMIDKPRQRSIVCEKKNDLGIICTCSKK